MNRSAGKRIVGRPARPGRRIMNRLLHRVECGLPGRGKGRLRHPPVFILGAPRCGSTLLYQLMLDHFDLGYLSNFHCLFYGAPSLAERFVRPGKRKRTSSFRSEYGAVTGWNAPSECGEYWYRFFRRRPQYVPVDEMSEKAKRDLRASMSAIASAMGRPVLFKNLLCALRLGPITTALPESLFIVVRRDWLDTAHSILESRRKLFGNYDGWFSVEPRDVGEIEKLPVHEQPIEQIRSVHALIEEARNRFDPKRFIDVDYADLCGDTCSTLDRLADFFDAAGLKPARSGEVPAAFEIKRDVRIDGELYEKMKDYLKANPPSQRMPSVDDASAPSESDAK